MADGPMIEVAGQYDCGMEGTARRYMREGWSHRERDFTWTEGTCSRIVLPHEAGEGQVVLEISINPMLFIPVLRAQTLVVSVNGHAIADEIVLGECSLAMNVPAHALALTDVMDITLDCPTAAIPAEIGMSADDRRLGVAVREVLVFRTAARAAFTPRSLPPLNLAAIRRGCGGARCHGAEPSRHGRLLRQPRP